MGVKDSIPPTFSFDVVLKQVFGRYDATLNILYSGCPTLSVFGDEASMRSLFAELRTLIRRCPKKPALFVDFENVRFDPKFASVYGEALRSLQPLLVGIYRYNLARDVSGILTSTVVRTANMGVGATGNVFASRESAMEAYLASK